MTYDDDIDMLQFYNRLQADRCRHMTSRQNSQSNERLKQKKTDGQSLLVLHPKMY